MITKYDLIKFMKNNENKLQHVYVEEEDAIYSKDGSKLCSMDEFLDTYRKNIGQSFECIYYSHISLSSVLRCKKCGTVIKTYEDERYEPYLCCPTCTDYKTSFLFWTKEEIESDVNKQEEINFLMELSERQKEQDERIVKRNGKYDWQIAEKNFYGKKLFIGIYLDCDDITKSYFKGLHLNIHIAKKSDGEMDYVTTKYIKIPLCWSQFYYSVIYRHFGKCHPDLRSKWYIGKTL